MIDKKWNSAVFFEAAQMLKREGHGPFGGFNHGFGGWHSPFVEHRRNLAHDYHAHLQLTFKLHPTVKAMLDEYRPAHWGQLLLEWPHVSEGDPKRLAYTVNYRKAEDNVQTVTAVGKYLQRHWPHVADHIKRDKIAMFTKDRLYFVHTTPEMVYGVNNGPRSCMASGYGSIEFREDDNNRHKTWLADPENINEPEWVKHPYSCYRPEDGWHMALREGMTGTIDGRALCLTMDGEKYFVRTYCRPATDGAYSETDQSLHAWLEHQGYSKESEWPEGARLWMPVGSYGNRRAPYIDGDCRHASHVRGDLFVIDPNGEQCCDNTNGYAVDSCTCECCNSRVSEDDIYSVGRSEDTYMCQSCRDNDYTLVTARGRYSHSDTREYYIRSEDAIEVDGESYDPDYLPDYIVKLHDGEYAHSDNVVSIDGDYYLEDDEDVVQLANGEWALRENTVEIDGDYYLEDDEDVVQLADSSWGLREGAWEEDETGDWYAYSSVKPVIADDGAFWHPDNAPEDDEPEVCDKGLEATTQVGELEALECALA